MRPTSCPVHTVCIGMGSRERWPGNKPAAGPARRIPPPPPTHTHTPHTHTEPMEPPYIPPSTPYNPPSTPCMHACMHLTISRIPACPLLPLPPSHPGFAHRCEFRCDRDGAHEGRLDLLPRSGGLGVPEEGGRPGYVGTGPGGNGCQEYIEYKKSLNPLCFDLRAWRYCRFFRVSSLYCYKLIIKITYGHVVINRYLL